MHVPRSPEQSDRKVSFEKEVNEELCSPALIHIFSINDQRGSENLYNLLISKLAEPWAPTRQEQGFFQYRPTLQKLDFHLLRDIFPLLKLPFSQLALSGSSHRSYRN